MKNKKNKPNKIWLRVCLALLPIISLINMLAPLLVLFFINKKLRSLKGLYGNIQGLQISVLKNRCTVNGLFLDRIDEATAGQTMFFSVKELEIVFEWAALWKGQLVCDINADMPSVSFIKSNETTNNTGSSKSSFTVPIWIKHFKAQNAAIEFADYNTTPIVELETNSISVTGSNLSNYVASDEPLPTEISLSGKVYSGTFHSTIKVNVLNDKPSFDVNLEIEGVDMVGFNSLFKAYGNFDINKGTLDFYTELAAADGKFTGYVKPIITDLDVVGPEDRRDGVFQYLWENLVGAIAEIFQNQKHEQLATKIPFKGTFKNLHVNVWYAILETLRNAFVCALKPSIDYEINIKSITKK